ncbi:hypothetical protein C8F04DRAFT_1203242 [Mycena alexandri]|uniref:Uncharacterized protein n=1 Tax=Mycena alexandri TaxID=1745969 RepID=A0AAD6WLY8_9AGAR|nr:hypothetical protein C8F04DRAFT_1203242 [Mycena alexandri]
MYVPSLSSLNRESNLKTLPPGSNFTWDIALSKLYANCLLSSLNVRHALQLASHVTSTTANVVRGVREGKAPILSHTSCGTNQVLRKQGSVFVCAPGCEKAYYDSVVGSRFGVSTLRTRVQKAPRMREVSGSHFLECSRVKARSGQEIPVTKVQNGAGVFYPEIYYTQELTNEILGSPEP